MTDGCRGWTLPTTTRSGPFGSSAPSRRRRVPESGSRPVLGLTQFLSCGAPSVPAACLHASFPQDVLLDLAVFRAGKLRDNVDEARDGELLQPRLAEGCDLRRMGNLPGLADDGGHDFVFRMLGAN